MVISAKELFSHKGEYMIVDVRTPEEFSGELGHIPGAILIPLDTFQERFTELDKKQKIVLVCRSGKRSQSAAEFLKKHGYSLVMNLDGGMMKWNELGYEVET